MDLSVVIPTRGRTAELARALGRLDGQTCEPDRFEVLVVADSVGPEEKERLDAVIGKRPYMTSLLDSPGSGASAARNEGVRRASAPLILFIGDDILAEPELVAQHLAWHARHPAETTAVLGHVRWAKEIRPTAFHRWLDRGMQFDYGAIDGEEAGWGRFYTANVSLKRSLLERAGGFDEQFEYLYEDLDLGYRLHRLGLRLLYNPAAGAEHLHAATLMGWRERMALAAPAERRFVAKHPEVRPYFYERFSVAAAQAPSRGLAARLDGLVPERLPWLGPKVRERADLWYEQQLAPGFLAAWELPETAVSPEEYDEHYYRHWCAGNQEWVSSSGGEVAGMYPGALELAGFQPGETLVDIGAGRGELVAVAAKRGAARAVGVEYSPTAVELAKETLRAQGIDDRAEVMLADARAIPLPERCADLVTMLDVVEHLTPSELERALGEAHRILKPGGRIFIHTLPNRSVYEITYRFQRALFPSRRRHWPADPRNDYERRMHVNEQTVTSLRRALRKARFERVQVRLGEWMHTDFVPDEKARRLYSRLARLPFMSRLAVADIWAEGRRPAR